MMKTPISKLSLILAATTTTQLNSIAFAQNNPRSGFKAVNVQEFISYKRIKVSTPKAVAVQLFSNEEEQEGRRSEDISVTYPTTRISHKV